MSDDDEWRRPKRPKTKARLEQLITQWQKDSGQPVARLNLRIAAMMLVGALARALDSHGHAAFAAKGGIAMELRMGDRARATRDIDLVLRSDPGALADTLDAGLREPYDGFSFRRSRIATLRHRPQIKQLKVQVSFAGRTLSSPLLEIAPVETGREEFSLVPGSPLDAVGLHSPEAVLVLATPWQIAQKLHAVTETHTAGHENPRFRDLVDLQLLETLQTDLAEVRDACERVFAVRGQQRWPPTLTVQPSWRTRYPALVDELNFGIRDVRQAAQAVRDIIDRISRA